MHCDVPVGMYLFSVGFLYMPFDFMHEYFSFTATCRIYLQMYQMKPKCVNVHKGSKIKLFKKIKFPLIFIVIFGFYLSDKDDCASGPCVNFIKCIDKVRDYKCECEDGYTGKNCDIGE